MNALLCYRKLERCTNRSRLWLLLTEKLAVILILAQQVARKRARPRLLVVENSRVWQNYPFHLWAAIFLYLVFCSAHSTTRHSMLRELNSARTRSLRCFHFVTYHIPSGFPRLSPRNELKW